MGAFNQLFKKLSSKQCSEFGLVAIMVFAILAWYFKSSVYSIAVVIVSLVTLVVPMMLYPFAAIWYALGNVLNQLSSRVILTVIFFVVVVPVAFFRRVGRKDNLKIRQFKKEKSSVMVVREHLYNKEDLQHTF